MPIKHIIFLIIIERMIEYMSGTLYIYDNYISHYSNIINTDIKCYDIKQANINILYDCNIIDINLYNHLKSIRKIDREIYVGNLLKKDKSLSKILSMGFLEARRLLFESNNIEDSSVLAIKKDAVYVIEKPLTYTKFNSIDFILSEEYTSFYRLEGLELYYNGKTDVLNVKGIGDETIERYHKNSFVLLLKAIFRIAEQQNLEYVLMIVQNFINMYLNYEMDIECYREFNRNSCYRIKYNTAILYSQNNDVGLNCLSDDIITNFKELVDISYNYQILLEIYGFYFDRYMDKK